MIVEGQQNIKVHFAAVEQMNQCNSVQALGGKYSLYTAYPFIERMMYDKPSHPIVAAQFSNNVFEIPQHVISNNRHTIQDSGLFTLMFGSKAGNKDKAFLDRYYEKLIEFTVKYGAGASVVEMDTQKVFGPESAWNYRRRMREDLNNRVINVYHLEDGQTGLDRLIEFSDYIAISVPELRKAKKKNGLVALANYIKNQKPEIDIHLLGFTERRLFKQLAFCTSCDSSSYTSGIRYGFIKGKKVSGIITEKAKSLISPKEFDFLTQYMSEATAFGLLLNIKSEMQKYEQHAGPQD